MHSRIFLTRERSSNSALDIIEWTGPSISEWVKISFMQCPKWTIKWNVRWRFDDVYRTILDGCAMFRCLSFILCLVFRPSQCLSGFVRKAHVSLVFVSIWRYRCVSESKTEGRRRRLFFLRRLPSDAPRSIPSLLRFSFRTRCRRPQSSITSAHCRVNIV